MLNLLVSRYWKFLLAVVVLCLTATCQNAPAPSAESAANRGDLRLVVITHGTAGDAFWGVFGRGVEQAQQDMGVQVEFELAEVFDIVAMRQRINEAVASQPDGLIVSITDAAQLSDSVQAAVTAEIPVISVNSGSDVAESLGVLTHIGQTEYAAGLGAGRQMGANGVTFALCINHEVGNLGLDERCQGFTDGLAETGGVVEVLELDFQNPDVLKQQIVQALTVNTEIDGILTLAASPALLIQEALTTSDDTQQVALATFDLNADILQAVQQGELRFAIDQQPYVQGYLSVTWMTLYLTNGNQPVSPITLTGPTFITAENVEQVIEFSERGTR